MVAKFNFPWSNKKMKQNLRYEIFNFKDAEGQEKYKQMTSGINLTKCFENQGCNTETASKKWLKEYKNILQRCFKKIRITSKDKSSDIIKTIQNKSKLMEDIEKIKDGNLDENTVQKLIEVKIKVQWSKIPNKNWKQKV